MQPVWNDEEYVSVFIHCIINDNAIYLLWESWSVMNKEASDKHATSLYKFHD